MHVINIGINITHTINPILQVTWGVSWGDQTSWSFFVCFLYYKGTFSEAPLEPGTFFPSPILLQLPLIPQVSIFWWLHQLPDVVNVPFHCPNTMQFSFGTVTWVWNHTFMEVIIMFVPQQTVAPWGAGPGPGLICSPVSLDHIKHLLLLINEKSQGLLSVV